ncbi:unnamed protein product [Strongylus vulgaris]|uniref:Hypoxia up-regulated protein 1 n=1 Tax=Strongylus vulgaris TaxID=40348 RepID=A0A3P7IS92_STRVU|nr:unnamed protein product [Strongylus vulgaris]
MFFSCSKIKYFSLEQFEKREKHARERAAAENDLEGYAFEVTQLLENEEFLKHATEEEKNKIGEECKRIRTWLEDDTTPETKTSDFTKHHVTLKALVRPVKKRVEEAKTLLPAITNLESLINSSRIMSKMGGDDEKSLFNKTDADAFAKKLDKVETWLKEKKEAQAKRQPYEDPVLLTSEVAVKLKSLDRELGAFMKKMRQTKLEDLEKMMKKKDADGKEKTENTTDNEKEGEKSKKEEGEAKKEEQVKNEEEQRKEEGEQKEEKDEKEVVNHTKEKAVKIEL